MTAPLPAAMLDAIEARANAATEGPWSADDRGTCIEVSGPLFHVAQIDTSYDHAFDRSECEADATFIASARSDVPALTAEVRRLQDREAELAEALEATETDALALLDQHVSPEVNKETRLRIIERIQARDAALPSSVSDRPDSR